MDISFSTVYTCEKNGLIFWPVLLVSIEKIDRTHSPVSTI